MKKSVAWVAGLVGVAALGRWLARRSRGRAALDAPEPPAADPAEELRRRLDESRGTGEAPSATPAPEAESRGAEQSVEERRAAVHQQAEDAIAAMRESGL